MLEVRYFDGRSSRGRAAQLSIQDHALRVQPVTEELDGFTPLAVPLARVRWPERTRHGGRLAVLPDGGSLQAIDIIAWDAWVSQHTGLREGLVLRLQQNWRGVALALVLLVATIGVFYQRGLPALARAVTAMVPQRIDALIGREALASLDGQLLGPSRLAPEEQERIRAAFERMVRHAHSDGAPSWRLEFRAGRRKSVGPNALALPGGVIVLTDELVQMVPGDSDAVLGVLAHEFGHVRQRHAMRQLVQASAVGFATSLAFGDYGTLISAAPVALATLGYSREAEREADHESVRLMRAAGISPRAMVRFFEALAKRAAKEPDTAGPLDIAFSTHPATSERIAFFSEAAGR
jgi:predicted Zn-dependent protease